MKAMHYQNEPAQEFAHIRAMVLLLEQLVQQESSGLRATAVTSPEYWRARLKAAANLPTELQPQVPILLARLDAMDAASPDRLGLERQLPRAHP